jgi:hypothetical protein
MLFLCTCWLRASAGRKRGFAPSALAAWTVPPPYVSIWYTPRSANSGVPRCPVANERHAHAVPAASAATKRVEPSQKKPCFVISPIGPDDSDTRKKADQVLKYIIRASLSDTYDPVDRADDIKKPGIITLQVVERLINAPMVVADLTDANANVYYELAIRHLVKKPVVHLINEGQQPPFDVAPMRYIPYNLSDLDSVARAVEELRSQAAGLEGGEVTLTIIQFAGMLDSARGEEEKGVLNAVLGIQSALSNLQSDVRQVRAQLSEQLSYVTERVLRQLVVENARWERIDSQAGRLSTLSELPA